MGKLRTNNKIFQIYLVKTEYFDSFFSWEPTKQDVNVLNALSNRDIDPFLYPNVRKWKFAMTKYSKEEKES